MILRFNLFGKIVLFVWQKKQCNPCVLVELGWAIDEYCIMHHKKSIRDRHMHLS